MYAEMVRNSKAGWRHCHKINKCMLRWCHFVSLFARSCMKLCEVVRSCGKLCEAVRSCLKLCEVVRNCVILYSSYVLRL